jgi:hypothetical protein
LDVVKLKTLKDSVKLYDVEQELPVSEHWNELERDQRNEISFKPVIQIVGCSFSNISCRNCGALLCEIDEKIQPTIN